MSVPVCLYALESMELIVSLILEMQEHLFDLYFKAAKDNEMCRIQLRFHANLLHIIGCDNTDWYTLWDGIAINCSEYHLQARCKRHNVVSQNIKIM